MKALLQLILIFSAVVTQAAITKKSTVPAAGAVEAYAEIKNTFGILPTFFREFPPEAVAGAWQEFRDVQLSPTTALDAKTKDLIGLAVASQIPCSYCVYFHKKAAKFNGASPREMNYAIAIAASTRKWSTYFYGSQISLDSYKTDVNKLIAAMKSQHLPPDMKTGGTTMPEDATGAIQDMEKLFGFSPEFIKSYSSRGLAGAWNEMKTLEMNAQAPFPSKVVDLISLAVSAQIPCQYCIYSDTEFAKMDGANKDEIQEAVALAGLVRHWSTVLNGLAQPQKSFEKEVDQIFKNLQMKRDLLNKRISNR